MESKGPKAVAGGGRPARALSLAALACLGITLLLAVVLLVAAFPGRLWSDPAVALTVAVLAVLRLIASLLSIHANRAKLADATTAVDIALVLLVGPGPATLAVSLAAAVYALVEASRERLGHPLLTIARAVVAVGMAGLAYDSLIGKAGFAWTLDTLGRLLAMAAVYVLFDVIAASMPLLRRSGEIATDEDGGRAWFVAAQYVALVAVGLIGAAIFAASPVASLLLLLPVSIAQYVVRPAVAARRGVRLAIESLAEEIDRRESYTAQHSVRVADYTRKLCQALRLSSGEADLIIGVAKIHDLGKMNLWPEMLHKPGPLDDAERLEMNRHPAYGAQILAGFVDYKHAQEIILHHHERYDGAGYPAGLRGEQIPLGSRIVAVVDAFDAMTSNRPYRGALPFERAIEELQTNAGRQFDPAVVEAFLKIISPEDVPHSSGRFQLGRPAEPIKPSLSF